MHVCIHVCTCMCMYLCVRVYVCAHACASTCMYICMCVYVYLCVYACACVCVYKPEAKLVCLSQLPFILNFETEHLTSAWNPSIQLGDWITSPGTCLWLPRSEFPGISLEFLAWVLASELGSLCLCDKHCAGQAIFLAQEKPMIFWGKQKCPQRITLII